MAALTLWRLVQQKHAHVPFSGEGGLYVEGRWHPVGLRVSYASETSSLALLEKVVSTPPDGLKDVAFALIEARVEARDVVRVEDWAGLPDGWEVEPPPYAQGTQMLGVRFVREAPAALLSVPSAINLHERNFVFNPAHPRAVGLAIVRATPFRIDARLWRQG